MRNSGAMMSAGPETAIRHADLAAFLFIGIEARTDNRRETGPDGIIPRQWRRFFEQGLAARIPNRTGPSLYALYTDYASDRHREYSFLIGARVEEGPEPPAGMVAKLVPAGRYRIFTSQPGPLPVVVPRVWQEVWALEEQGSLKRAYRADFELYDERSRDPEHSQVDLFIGLE